MEWWSQVAATLLLGCAIAAIFLVRGDTSAKARPSVSQPTPTGDKLYTAAEVAAHQTADDCWLIIDRKVYDVTPYIAEHPGGDAIFKHAGSDVTTGFHGPQHPPRVYDLIDDFYVGKLR